MTDLPPGAEEANGKVYMRLADGGLRPIEMVKPQESLEDRTVRDLLAAAEEAALVLRAFKTKTFDEVDAFIAVLADKYGAAKGGAKGNVTLQTMDGCFKIIVQVANLISFGAELAQAKTIIDELVLEWGADSRPEIRAMVMNAFRVDQKGNMNRGAILGLRQLEITDPRWLKAMEAIADSINVDGTKRYVRFYRRETPDAAWRQVSLDLATA